MTRMVRSPLCDIGSCKATKSCRACTAGAAVQPGMTEDSNGRASDSLRGGAARRAADGQDADADGDVKIRWIRAIAAAGVPEIEVGSFVPPKLIPAMADTGEVVRAVRDLPCLIVALAPNLKGAQLAAEAGARPGQRCRSASARGIAGPTPTARRRRRWPRSKRIVDWVRSEGRGARGRGGVQHGVRLLDRRGDPDQAGRRGGVRPGRGGGGPDRAGRYGRLRPSGADPRSGARGARRRSASKLEGLHLHDTMGLGLANALAGLEEGIRSFDAALAGLGGCPFAPGASGNIVTEDLVFMLESMGFETGIDLQKLVAARTPAAGGVAGGGSGTAPWRALAFRGPSKRRRDATGGHECRRRWPGCGSIEFTHMIMGPAVGLCAGRAGRGRDQGGAGRRGRQAGGRQHAAAARAPGTGFFAILNRNKRSMAAGPEIRRRARRSCSVCWSRRTC